MVARRGIGKISIEIKELDLFLRLSSNEGKGQAQCRLLSPTLDLSSNEVKEQSEGTVID